MPLIAFRPRFSRNTLLLMALVAGLFAALVYWKFDLLRGLYLENQLTTLGWVVNGAILALFALGLVRMVVIFLDYTREEAAVERFVRNQELDLEDPLEGVPARSLMARRFQTMERLFESATPIDQSALASTLLASESTRTSFPKYVNNILILTGVFGTIVSLSIALLGASDLLENTVNAGGMGLVIHGMSTALSTTITAILCYLFYGYFYLKLTDAQTNLLSAVEQVTSTYLAPRFRVETETTLYEFTGLVRTLQNLVHRMEQSHKLIMKVETQLLKAVDRYQDRAEKVDQDLARVIDLLRRGFRLRDDEH